MTWHAKAFAGGLIASGALLLVFTLVWPRRSFVRGAYRRELDSRIRDAATAFSVVATFAGATMALVTTGFGTALVAFLLVIGLFYLAGVVATFMRQRDLPVLVRSDRSSYSSDTVSTATAVRLGLATDSGQAWRMVGPAAGGDLGEEAALRAADRTRIRWALAHPLGGKTWPSDLPADYL